MTRSEAAKICQSIKFILENSDYTEAVEEALDMAIAALKQLSLPKIIIRQGEQEPCDKRTDKHTETHACDCISRQAAIDALEREQSLIERPITETKWFDLGLRKAQDVLSELPSADRPTGHWIDDDEQQILMKKFIEKGENWKVCNICGAGMRVGAKYDTDEQYHDFFHNYCPYCGARMESGEE